MTEYDYSPEGYSKYMETQNRVSNWVSEQNTRMTRYTNPYTQARSISTPPTDYAPRSSSRHRDGDPRSHQRSSSSSHAPRPEPKRSLTTPAEAIPRSLHTHVPTQPATYYQHPAPVSYVAPTSQMPKGYNTSYREYRYEPNSGEIVIPRPRAGETYVIIPPAGRRLEVVVSMLLS